jgi:DTW domain-containing protein YfiP
MQGHVAPSASAIPHSAAWSGYAGGSEILLTRHYTSAPFCVTCRVRVEICVCAAAPRLEIPTRLILVIHTSEWARTTNTGHLARLGIRNAEIRLHGRPHRPVSAEGIVAASASTLVLYPGRGASPLTQEYLAPLTRPLTLLVPDGNWMQAKNMMRRVPMLNGARPVRLEEPALDLPRLRWNYYDDRRSTFEAIAQTLGILEGPETEAQLLDFYRLLLKRRRAT